MATEKNVKNILYLIQQFGLLTILPRAQLEHLATSKDTVASHGYQTAAIAYCLSRMEGLSHAEALQSVGMAIFHDVAEARTGNIGFVEKNYIEADRDKAINDALKDISFSEDVKNLLKEYKNKQTLISLCARDADSLAQIYSEWALMWQGNKLAGNWFESDFNDRIPSLKTESAKKLAYAMKDSNPNEWWWSQFLEKDTVKDINQLLSE